MTTGLKMCDHCKKPKKDVRRSVADGSMTCKSCYNKVHAEQCGTCKKFRTVAKRDALGRAMCDRCLAKSKTVKTKLLGRIKHKKVRVTKKRSTMSYKPSKEKSQHLDSTMVCKFCRVKTLCIITPQGNIFCTKCCKTTPPDNKNPDS